jgi:uncharacterized protein YkwD
MHESWVALRLDPPGLRLLPPLAVVALAVLLPALAVAADAPPVARADRLEANVLDELNLVRLEHGLRQLRLSPNLTQAADHHSLTMVRAGYFAHESPDGSHFARRIKAFYKPRAIKRKWQVAENLIWRTDRLTARAAVTAWLASPGHRENLLGRKYREVGISAVRAVGAPGVYGHRCVVVLTVDFGAR